MTNRTVRTLVTPAILIFILLTGVAHAATIHVPGDQPTVTAGLAAAAPRDIVLVACGTYFEYDLSLPSGVTLRGDSSDPSCVVIDAQGAGRVMSAMNLELSASVENLTLRNGIADRGAGLVVDAATVSVLNCCFALNHAGSFGGGVQADKATVKVEQCRFISNSTDGDGGGAEFVRSNFSITDSHFEHNVAEFGGGVKVSLSGSNFIRDCSFGWNVARNGGGAIASDVGGMPNISYCFFQWNSAFQGGAILSLRDHESSVDHCTIIRNYASRGGGLFAWVGTITLTNSIVAFSGGSAGVDYYSGGGIDPFCTNLYGNEGGDWIDCVEQFFGIHGNISEDPNFCLGDNPTGHYSLNANSICAESNNPDCGQIGAFGVACGNTATERKSWSQLKSLY